MFSGFTHSLNCCSVTYPSSKADCFNVRPFLWAFFAIEAALSYPIYGFSAVTNINELLSNSLILFSLGFIPTKQLCTNDLHPSPKSRIDLNTFEAIKGLKTFN